MATKQMPNVISLLSSSDNEGEAPASRARPPPRKENVRPISPKRSTKTKPLERSTSSGNISKPPRPSDKLKATTNRLITKHTETITIISSSPPPISPLVRHQQPACLPKPYPKIFGALSSDPIFSQSSPPPIPPVRLTPRRSPRLNSKPKDGNSSLFASLLGSDLVSDDSDLLLDIRPTKASQEILKLKTTSTTSISKPPASNTAYRGLNKSTVEILESLNKQPPTMDQITKRRKVDKIDLEISDSSVASSPEPVTEDMPPTSSAPLRKGKLTEAEKEARRLERDALKLSKAADKEALKEQKKREKDAKLVAKNEAQAMSTANKLKNSHVATVTEMIVNISSDLFQSREGIQLQQFLKELNVQHAPFDSDIPNVVKWRRIVEAEWDPEDDVFVPIPRDVRDEKHVLVVLEAKQFVELTSSSEMAAFVSRVKSAYPLCNPIFVVIGLSKLVNKSKSADARRYANEVRNRMNRTSKGTSRAGNSAPEVDEDGVEDALLRLQVVHNCLICQTTGYMDTAEAISSYTQHISQIPYRNAKATLNNSTNFCMDVGQVRSGISVDDTYSKMLQQVHMSTEGVAKAIQARYPSAKRLYEAFLESGDDVLKDIPIVRNKGGGATTGRALGPAMSRKMARVFTGRNEWELES